MLNEHADELASKGIAVPALPDGSACIYAEWHAPDAAAAEAALMAAAERLPEFGADPDACILADVLALYERDLAASGLEHLIFGHIGANHLHVNILPRHPADYDAGRALYARWAAQVIAWGGSISAEHGIGKLKRDLFRQMAGDAALAQMRALKKLFDPDGLLNPGTLL